MQLAPSPVPRRTRCQLIRWLCRRRRTPVSEAVQEEQRGRREDKSRASHPQKDMQVVVAIAMPCRPRRVSSPKTQDYSIGVQTIPWNDGA